MAPPQFKRKCCYTLLSLIESDVIKPVMDKVFPFDQTNEALFYVETGCAKGKVVIKVTK